ncbi:MAG: helix-turn-helix transcriptional regulator [Thermodesulfovibrionales bacterium]|nr:helix-turn-helix transcriptional regulator [Thermodesulfovibrionales bacterium]
MGKPGEDIKADTQQCPVELTLGLMGNKWKILILRELFRNGLMRFNRLHRSIDGITQKVLSEKLKQMEADGFVNREAFAEIPPRVEYSLTPLGRTLRPVMNAIYNWGDEYLANELSEEGW